MKRCQKCWILLSWIILIAGTYSCEGRKHRALSGSGTLEATEIMISSKIAGTVVDLPVNEGDEVGEGQVIAQIETEKIELQKQQLLAGLEELRLNLQNGQRSAALAKDALDNTEKKFNRIKSLLAENSTTQQQYDDVETAYRASLTQYENAVSSLKGLKAKEKQLLLQIDLVDSQLSDGRIVSPIRGTVVEKYIEKGEIARPGGPVVTLADLENMWIKIYFKEYELGKIKLNAPADLRISGYPERSFPGRISWISPKAEFTPKMVQTKEARADLVYSVRIEVANPDKLLKIGMPADVEIKE